MKKRLLTTVWLMLLTSVFAITSMAQTVTVEQNTAGGLGDALTAQGVELSTIKNLKVTGKMSAKDFCGYVVAQCLGALTGSGILAAIFTLGGVTDKTGGFGSNGLDGVS